MSESLNAEFEVRLRLAQSEATPADLLATLATDAEQPIREAVARNPNTSIELLHELCKDFPEAIQENPVFNLLMLEDPDSYFVRLTIARSHTTDEATLRRLSTLIDEEILRAVVCNPNTPTSVLETLIQNPPPIYNDLEHPILSAIAKSPNTPESLLIQLANFKDYYLESSIALNPKAPICLLEKFAERRDFDIQFLVVLNPNAPTAILEKLASSSYPTIRAFVRDHPNVSETAIATINALDEQARKTGWTV